MNSIVKKLVVLGALSIGAVALAPAAQARAIGGYGGSAVSVAEQACIGESWGSAVNTGCDRVTFEVPLVVNPAGNYNAMYRVYAATPGGVQCNTVGVDGNGVPNSVTPLLSAPLTGAVSTISPGWTTVLPGGSLFGACYVRRNSKLVNVLW